MGGQKLSWFKITAEKGKILHDSRRDGLDEEREEYLAQWDGIVEKLEKKISVQATAVKIREIATKRETDEENDFQLEKTLGTTPKN